MFRPVANRCTHITGQGFPRPLKNEETAELAIGKIDP